MRKLSGLKIQVFFFVFVLIIASLACHLPGGNWWVDVDDIGDALYDELDTGLTLGEHRRTQEAASVGDDRADSSGGSPAGTFKATIVYVQSDDILSELIDEQVSITATEDGSITGSAAFRRSASYSDGDGCLERIEQQTTGSITGEIKEVNSDYYSGPIEFKGTMTTTVLESCGLAENGVVPVSGSGMINFNDGVLRGGQFDDYFRFEGD